VFVDSESISTASGLGMRHKIGDGSFSKVGGPGPRTRAAASGLLRWELSATERAKVDSIIEGGVAE
jgi:hypothetical protein